MKTVVNWLCDPCLHVLILGLVLLYTALVGSADDSGERNADPLSYASYPATTFGRDSEMVVAARIVGDAHP